MPTSISIGYSQYPDPATAVLQACVQVKNQLNSVHTDFVIVFATPQYIVPEIQAVITRTLKPKRLIGSSTHMIILSDCVTDKGIAIIGINSSEMLLGVSALNDTASQEMQSTGFDLARRAIQDMNAPHREMFLTFAGGIEKNFSHFIRGVKEALGGVFPVLGAISSDDFHYTGLSQFFHDQILHNSAVGLLWGGPFKLAIGLKHGFKPLGKPRTITRVDGMVIHTIDDQPAINIYKHFLGVESEQLKNMPLNSFAALYPLGVYLEEARQYLLRNIIDILEDGSIVCHEGIPQGAEVHLMISNKEFCHFSTIEAAELVKATLGDKPPKLVLVFESLVRQKILGEAAINEVQVIKNILGPAAPMAGMYSYGEIGPFGAVTDIKNIYLHNGSILIIAVA